MFQSKPPLYPNLSTSSTDLARLFQSILGEASGSADCQVLLLLLHHLLRLPTPTCLLSPKQEHRCGSRTSGVALPPEAHLPRHHRASNWQVRQRLCCPLFIQPLSAATLSDCGAISQQESQQLKAATQLLAVDLLMVITGTKLGDGWRETSREPIPSHE